MGTLTEGSDILEPGREKYGSWFFFAAPAGISLGNIYGSDIGTAAAKNEWKETFQGIAVFLFL